MFWFIVYIMGVLLNAFVILKVVTNTYRPAKYKYEKIVLVLLTSWLLYLYIFFQIYKEGYLNDK